MIIREVRPEEKSQFNLVAVHPLQSWEWGDFREKTGVDVVRLGVFEGTNITKSYQITFHSLPKLPFTIGYMPKSIVPDIHILGALHDLAIKKRAIYIKFEPNFYQPITDNIQSPVFEQTEKFLKNYNCVRGRPLFTRYSFLLDLTKAEDELLANCKQKTRYNIGIAQKKNVQIKEDNSDEAFSDYLKLTFETTHRQGFYAHDKTYHQKMWAALRPSGMVHLLKAIYENETLVTWILFKFGKVLYYPYGASSSKHRNVMASNLMMWEAIKFGKNMGCRLFDMWGSLGPNANPNDPWIGFHHFKEGYNPILTEFIGSFDFVIDQPKYQVYTMLDNLRWKYLKMRAKLPF